MEDGPMSGDELERLIGEGDLHTYYVTLEDEKVGELNVTQVIAPGELVLLDDGSYVRVLRGEEIDENYTLLICERAPDPPSFSGTRGLQ